MLTSHVIDNAEEFESLREDWQDLLLDSMGDTLFLTWEWMYTWWKHLADERTLHIITVRSGRQLIGIAPLCLSSPRIGRMMPFKYLEFIASGDIGSDYLSFILRKGHEAAALEAIAQMIARQRHMVELTRIEKASEFATLLPAMIRRIGGAAMEVTTNTCPYIDLRGKNWDDYLASLSKRHHKNVRRRLRRLNSEFTVGFIRVSTETERRKAFSEFTDIHTANWRHRSTDTAFSDGRIVSFHEEFSELALRRGWLRLFLLRLDSTTAAAVYQFMYRDTYLYFQSGLSDNFVKYSPGMVLLALSIQEALSEGAKTFDLLHDNEAYKYLWADEDRDLVRIEIYPSTLQGALSKNVVKVKNMIRRPKTLARTHT